MSGNSDYEIIKNAVQQARLQQAEISGQIKSKMSTLDELGFSGKDCISDANKFLDLQESVLDKAEAEVAKQKQEISDEYTKIIQQTAPGTEGASE